VCMRHQARLCGEAAGLELTFVMCCVLCAQAVEELRRVIAYRDQELGDNPPKFLGLALSARRNLCIHPRVRRLSARPPLWLGC
jgi:hypothetical protein